MAIENPSSSKHGRSVTRADLVRVNFFSAYPSETVFPNLVLQLSRTPRYSYRNHTSRRFAFAQVNDRAVSFKGSALFAFRFLRPKPGSVLGECSATGVENRVRQSGISARPATF